MASKDFKSRDDWRKEKQLEEARKAGTAAPLQDEEGRDINPHIPQYIAQAPWYLARNNPSLKHQRTTAKGQVDGIHTWYARGAKASTAPRKYKKGACTNCGATTHQAKDCCERPRAKGAKYTGVDIQPDEVIQDLTFDYEGKHDRWNGYDPEMHRAVMEKFEKTDELRRRSKAEDVESKLADGVVPSAKPKKEGDDSSDSDDDAEEDKKDFEDSSSVLHSKDPRTRTTIRNLRIREDTAKYLRNLSIDSALYDPKTRSMRENPTPHIDPSEAVYAGDNFIRKTGDSLSFGQAQRYAWEAYEKGQEVHLQASPSAAELMFSQYKEKKTELKDLQREAVLRRYGGEEHMNSVPKELILSQTEHYVEYARDGRVIKGQEAKTTAHSKYEEDVYINNHTSVWGSYWENGQWGYACCKQLVRRSYCTGEAGRLAKESILQEMKDKLAAAAERGEEEEEETSALKPRGEKSAAELAEEELKRKERLAAAIAAEEEKAGQYVEKDERKRTYNSRTKDTYEVTEEEMEAFRLKRQRSDDPMAAFLKPAPKKPSKGKKD